MRKGMRRLILASALLLALPLVAAAPIQRRVALVIGNSRYQHVQRLLNPVNDAEDMAEVLKNLGFEVVRVLDGTLAQMDEAMVVFSRKLPGAAVSMFYYAGHGVEWNGSNYLLPVDSRIVEEFQLPSLARDVNNVLRAMSSSGCPLNMIVLDACRNNPFAGTGRSIGGERGLGVIGNAPRGALIVYATDPGSVALDGSGRNGVFTEALLRHIAAPGVSVKDMFDLVGADVSRATDGEQNPWVSAKFYDKFYMADLDSAGGIGSVTGIGVASSPARPADPAAANAPQPQAARTAELFVDADRDGAEVFVNGRKAGTSGSILRDLPAGVEIEVEARSGHWIARRALTLRPGELEEISLELELMRGNAQFLVERPQGYRLLIDRTEIGQLSATGIARGLPAGAREAELLGEGLYWKGRIEVDPASTAAIQVTPWEVGSLSLNFPPDAIWTLTALDAPARGRADPSRGSIGGSVLERLPTGRYRVEVGGGGYDRRIWEARVSKGGMETLALLGGGLVVETDPPGMSVKVDGKAVGKSPLRLENLDSGYVTVAIDSPEWRPIEARKLIERGKTTLASFPLQPRSASLTISLPRDAPWSVHGQGGAWSRSGRGEAKLEELPVGDYTVEAGGGDYETWRETLTLGRGEARKIVPWTTGSLVVETLPPGAEIRLDGRLRGASPLVLSGLKAGSAAVSATAPDHKEAKASTAISVGKRTSLRLSLVMDYASLRLEIPPDALATLSGRDSRNRLGDGTVGDLPPGRYTVTIGGPGYETYVQELALGPGEERLLRPWKSGRLVVTTEPPEAEILIDGVWKGRGKAELSDLKPGYVTVSANLAEYSGVSQQKLIEVGKTTQAAFILHPRTASLTISVPGDARWSIRGRGGDFSRSGRGEASLDEIPAGDYSIEAGGGDFETWRATVILGRGEEKRIEPWTTGSLEVETVPPGAEIRVDGRLRGMSPIILSGLGPGVLTVTASVKDYKEASGSATIAIGKRARLSLGLAMDYASLYVDVPSDALVTLTGRESRARQGGGIIGDLPPGSYTISVGGPGYESYTQQLTLGEGDEKRVRPWNGGRLVVTTDPAEAVVFLDGVKEGTSPVSLSGISPGWASVSIKADGYQDFDRKEFIEIGKTTRAYYVLRPRAATLEISVPEGAAWRVFDQGAGISRSGLGKAELAELPAGEYSVEIGGGEFEAWIGTIELRRGEYRRIAPWSTGRVSIVTEPVGADISYDGINAGASPLTLELAPGKHSIRASREDYEDSITAISITAGTKKDLSMTLALKTGSVIVRAPMTSTTTLTNLRIGEKRSVVGTDTARDLPIGEYGVESSDPALKAVSSTITVKTREMETWIPWVGTIEVQTQPSGAEVLVNGERVGLSPVKAVGLPAGDCEVTSRKNGYFFKSQTCRIAANETIRITISLVKDSVIRGEVYVTGGEYRLRNGVKPISDLSQEETSVSDLWVMKTEVTQKDYARLMGRNYSRFKGDNLPVTGVAWLDAIEYANKLSAQDGLNPAYSVPKDRYSLVTCDFSATGWRLPTELEWEYAARGGSKSLGYAYSGSADIDAVAWYGENSEGKTHPVGKKKPNELGIFDMSGNVWEWCWDHATKKTVGKGSLSGMYSGNERIIRGGSCWEYQMHVTVYERNFIMADPDSDMMGFRLVRTCTSRMLE